VFPWLLIAVGCWFFYQLLRQNGRILLRLEALEARLGQPQARAPAPAPQGLQPGSPAPEFELPDLSGKPARLAQWRGRRLLVIFFNPKCGFCEKMAADLAALKPEDGDGRPMPLVITTGDPEENRRFFERHNIRCPVLVQKQDEVSSRYQAGGTPMGYAIDEEGVIATPVTIGAPDLLALAAVPVPPAPPSGEVAESLGDSETPMAGAGPHAPRTKGKANRGLGASRLKRDGLKAGMPAPPFRLPRLDGGEVSLDELRGRRVFLIFSDPDCGPCVEVAPALEQFHRGPAGVQVLMISRRDPEANRRKVAELGLTFPVVLQRHWEISMLYAMFATPIAYLIDEQGVLASDVAVGAQPIRDLMNKAAPGSPDGAAVDNGAYAAAGTA
jgi:peroxiredoxin